MERTESVVDERTTPSPEVLEKPVRRRFTVNHYTRHTGNLLAYNDEMWRNGQITSHST